MSTSNNQSGKIYSNQNATSYAGHPGYNQNTGIYSYGSGYQYHESTATHNPNSQYTSASIKESSYTTDSCNLSTNGESFASQYNQQPAITSTGSYFNLPYGTATNESENVNNHPSSGSNSQNWSINLSDNKNSTTYMQSNSQINTTTTRSAETRDIPHESSGSVTQSRPEQSIENITTEPTTQNHPSGLDFTISDLTISTS